MNKILSEMLIKAVPSFVYALQENSNVLLQI